MTFDSQRTKQLHAAKLKALVASALENSAAQTLSQITGTETGAFAEFVSASDQPAVAYLAEVEPANSLGPALAVAARASAQELHLFARADETGLVEPDTHRAPSGLDTLARRAALFDFQVAVWEVTGASTSRFEGSIERPFEPPPPRVPELVATLAAAGVDVVAEHGVVTGEVQGLEVARIVPKEKVPDKETPDEEGWRIEVGVGANDREAFGILHADEPVTQALQRVAELVRKHRTPGAEPHPLNRMAPARWLRSLLLKQPQLVDAKRLTPASPATARTGVADKSPAVAYGIGADEKPLVVVSTVGINLDLVPFAADAREFLDSSADLVLAMPQQDAHPLLGQMVEWLHASHSPTRIAEISNDWRQAS